MLQLSIFYVLGSCLYYYLEDHICKTSTIWELLQGDGPRRCIYITFVKKKKNRIYILIKEVFSFFWVLISTLIFFLCLTLIIGLTTFNQKQLALLEFVCRQWFSGVLTVQGPGRWSNRQRIEFWWEQSVHEMNDLQLRDQGAVISVSGSIISALGELIQWYLYWEIDMKMNHSLPGSQSDMRHYGRLGKGFVTWWSLVFFVCKKSYLLP